MDYAYENLGPERFQQFCQSLLNFTFPKTQAFPIGQPDGGRDVIIYNNRTNKDDILVFQVKFVRKDDRDIVNWLEVTLKNEAKKITRLIKRGAKEYYLITNLSGTGHLDVGTIDKVDKILKKYCSIPSYCWWRDDLNSKLNNDWNLKWIFPELLSSTDILRIIIESRINEEDRERRFNAIKSYLVDQYDLDSKVKFKQVELQNNLLDLFIDVPIKRKNEDRSNMKQMILFDILIRQNLDIKYLEGIGYKFNEDEYSYHEEKRFIGASTFFLNKYIQDVPFSIVLEGGPGQGKSTITQYICQVHRMRLLDKKIELNKIPDHHKNTSLRLPIKIDLRDFAIWLNNKNPFSISQEDIESGIKRQKSLESFISLHIQYFSGGIEFDVNDLHEIFKISKILLVLDGFDEIADINLREEIVDIITKGIKRIQNNTYDLQVIITSRPAAFLNSPGFSKEEFTHCYLDSVNSVLVELYSEKWINAKQLTKKEGNEIKKILQEKLQQPHIMDLTRNPMQLAILISLIHTKGFSLPDKRTAFYDSYIEVFFNRESEKDETVRNFRDLIIELHQYIAWVIHRDSEVGSSGRILQSELVTLLEKYLENEGHDITIASKLFNKMAERVVALVSRLQGTFEFEVQPLREYFCAKYLYSTAPYSPAGKEMTGTKPDRFDAMARNFYWLNVLRFYCGCFDKGELPSIIDRLEVLSNNSEYKLISHPRELSSILLSDWVFAQYPRLMQQVVKILLEGLGTRILLTSDIGYSYRSQELSLPKTSGRDEIVLECFKLLKAYPPKDYAFELINLILSNDNGQIIDIWKTEIENKKGIELINWLEYGMLLRILYKLNNKELISFFEDKKNILRKVSILILAGKGEFIESMLEVSNYVAESILDGFTDTVHFQNKRNFISCFWRIFEPNYYRMILNESDNCSCLQLISRYYNPEETFLEEIKFPKTNFLNNLMTNKYFLFYKILINELEKPVRYWNSKIEPWDLIVERGRKVFGDRILFYNFSCMGAGIKSSEIKSESFNELFEHKSSLVNRVRYARLRSTNYSWWSEQYKKIKTDNDRYLFILILITWGSTNLISKLILTIEECLLELPDNKFRILYLSLKKICFCNNQNSNYNYYFNKELPQNLSLKTLKILATKLRSKNLIKFKKDFFNEYSGDDPDIIEFLLEFALDNFMNNINVSKNLKIIKECYIKGSLNEKNIYEQLHFHRYSNELIINLSVAKTILEEPSKYPRVIVKVAESNFKKEISLKVKSVKEISENEKWFNK